MSSRPSIRERFRRSGPFAVVARGRLPRGRPLGSGAGGGVAGPIRCGGRQRRAHHLWATGRGRRRRGGLPALPGSRERPVACPPGPSEGATLTGAGRPPSQRQRPRSVAVGDPIRVRPEMASLVAFVALRSATQRSPAECATAADWCAAFQRLAEEQRADPGPGADRSPAPSGWVAASVRSGCGPPGRARHAAGAACASVALVSTTASASPTTIFAAVPLTSACQPRSVDS